VKTNTDPCATNPCQHEGYCVGLINDYLCQCDDEYTGTNCEIRQECDYYWNRAIKKSTHSWTHKETNHTEETCKQACIDTDGCYTVDYYPKTRDCWFGYNTNAEIYDDALSIGLDVTKSCSMKCEINWTRFPQTKGTGMTVSETGHSEESCKQACVATANCAGVNYYRDSNQTCWFGFTYDPEPVHEKASVYLKVDWNCPEGCNWWSDRACSNPL